MNTKSVVQLAAAILALGAAALMFWRSGSGEKIDLNSYEALGSCAAEEVSRELGGQGSIVMVIPDAGPHGDLVLEAQVAAFRKGLQQHGKVRLEKVESVKMDPFTSMRTGGAMPADQFPSLWQKYADRAGLVFFIGFPALAETELKALKERPAKLFVVSAALPGYEVLLRDGYIRLAIVPRMVASDQNLPAPKSLRECFDQEYAILRSGPDSGG